MSLRDQIMFKDPDRVFLNTSEFAEVREFRISNGAGGFIVFQAKTVWDNEMAKQLPIVKIHGVYQGDLVAYITHATLPRPPVAGELVYSPANQPWEVIDVTDEMGMWKLALSMTRSQPAFYGNN